MNRFLMVAALMNPTGLVAAQATPDVDRVSVEREVMAVLDQWMVGFNNRDIDAWEATWHFPHYRLASGQMRVIESAGLRDGAAVFAGLVRSGWHHSEWERRRIFHLSDTKVHVDTVFVRYREDGSVLASYESLYILTLEDGRWGIKMRSSYAG